MKILVCISVTPDTTSRVSFKNDNREYNPEGVQFILNPYDEWYALVKALEIREKSGGSVTVIHVGPLQHEPMIRKALAIGADDAIRIDGLPESSYDAAFQIATVVKDQAFDLILTGKETIDYQGAEVGAMLAEMLALPFVPFASKMDVEQTTATIERDIEGGVEVLQVQLPAVVSGAKGMAEQRIPNMKGIMTAKSKPLIVREPNSADELIRPAGFTLPPPKQGVRMIAPDDMDELVRLLHEEARVL